MNFFPTFGLLQSWRRYTQAKRQASIFLIRTNAQWALDLDLIIKLSVFVTVPGVKHFENVQNGHIFCVFSNGLLHTQNENNSIDAFAYVRIVEPD